MKYKNLHTQPSTSSLKIFLSFSCSHTVLCSLSNMPSTQALGVFALFFLVWNVLPLPSSPRLTITLGDKAFLTTCPFLHPSLSPTLLYFALHTKFQFTCYTVISLSQSFRTKCLSQAEVTPLSVLWTRLRFLPLLSDWLVIWDSPGQDFTRSRLKS